MGQAHRSIAVGLLLAGTAGLAAAQSIYTCTDSKGRRLTSDRPIMECLDRPQKELSPTGTVRRTIEPPMTADERAAAEVLARKQAEERQRQEEEKRRLRALLARYPNQAAHDKERAAALRQVEDVIAAGEKRIADLEDQRKKLQGEAEFYRNDPAKMPAKLKRQQEELVALIQAQRRFISDQQEERKRVNTRFDEELARLRPSWTPVAASAPVQAPASAPVPRRP